MDELFWAEADNAPLRRADWRFLLPDPAPGRSICRAGGLLGEAARLISAHTGTELGVKDACDLVIAVDPDASTLRAAHAALAPGAWCYMEWRFPFSAGPRRRRRALSAAGFEHIACYWPWPSPARARFWLPLDSRATSYQVRQRWRGGRTLAHRTARAALPILWQLAERMRLLRPVCAIARKPPVSGFNALRESRSLRERVGDSWSAWGLGPAPRHVSCLLVTEGNRSISKCVALIFAEADPRPRLAIKFPRVPAAIPALSREASVLKALHARHPGAFPGIPRVVFEEQKGARSLLVETALTGTPLRASIRRRSYRALALRATDWLVAFARRTARQRRSDWQERIAAPAIADFIRCFGDVADDHLVGRTRGLIDALGPLPVITEQRDFSPWNVLMDTQGELVVLDWESAELDGLPALDLVYFLTYLACDLERVRFDAASDLLREAYRRTLDPTSFTGQVRAECLARYAAELGLDIESFPALAMLAWLIHSRSDYRHITADAGGPPDRKALGRSVFLSFWEEEVRSTMQAARGSPPVSSRREPLLPQRACAPPP